MSALATATALETPIPHTLATGREVRLAARHNACATTSGLAPGFLQANLIVLPSRYAADFRLLCARNPVPCPLVGESAGPGSWNNFKSCLPGIEGSSMLDDIDIRRDAPKFNVYKDAKLVKEGCADIVSEWTDDHVAFLVGCSFSFESALTAAGLPPRHTVLGRNVPMYRTTLQLCPAGVFTNGTFVVSMRPYSKSHIKKVRDITRPYALTHGEPIAWGWEAVQNLGIKDLNSPEWGEAPLTKDGGRLSDVWGSEDDVPVFWGCGVTPQEAVMKAELEGIILAHAPGHMVLLDTKDSEIIGEHTSEV
ncbi:DUF1445 domain-containing protein [Thozetella sp. PMI_491]|nr:DUF1445 domain-containing protein [Thozetella sp. PMI_491]